MCYQWAEPDPLERKWTLWPAVASENKDMCAHVLFKFLIAFQEILH